MNFNYADWTEGTYQTSNDPIEFNGKNRTCNLCDKDAQSMDEYCDDHQRCVMCGDNDDCECEDEWSEVTACCESLFWGNTDICSECKEHAGSAWEEAVDSAYYQKQKVCGSIVSDSGDEQEGMHIKANCNKTI